MPHEVWMSISEWNFLKFELELVLISGKIPSISLKKIRYQNHTLASSQILSPLIFENPQLHDAVQVRPTASNMETDHGLEGPNQGNQWNQRTDSLEKTSWRKSLAKTFTVIFWMRKWTYRGHVECFLGKSNFNVETFFDIMFVFGTFGTYVNTPSCSCSNKII